MAARLTKFFIMKHITNKTNQYAITGIILLISIIFFNPPTMAKDLIEVVLDNNLDFATNNGNTPHTKIYQEFNMSVNFTTISLFDLSPNDFPINTGGYFENNSTHVQLKINQNNFATLKQSQPQNLMVNIPVANGKNFSLALRKSDPLSNDFQFKNTQGSYQHI